MLCCSSVQWYYLCVFFFFKQKTAYEMRISYWSSDVCSSDLTLMALRLYDRRRDGKLPPQGLAHVDMESDTERRAGELPVSRAARSEERRVGQECVSTRRSRWSPWH